MIAAGRMAEFEIVQTEAEVASQELAYEEARNQTDTARLPLLQLLALESEYADSRHRGTAGAARGRQCR